MPVREGTGAQGIRWNSVNRDRNHRWFVGRYAAFSLPPSPGRVDILEDLSRSLSFSLFPRRRVNYPAPLLVGLQLICSIHIWCPFQVPARKKTKTTECIPHLLQYEINRLEPIDESLKSSARASVFNRREIRKFLFRFSLRIVRGKFWNLSWNFKFGARKIGDDGEKNKSSEKASSRVCFSFSAKEKYLIRCWWSSARSSRSNDCGRRDFFNGHLNVPLLSSF